MMREGILSHIQQHLMTIDVVGREMVTEIECCCRLMVDALSAGRKILIMGNGGSAADAQHFAAEMVGRFLLERRALPAIALTTDTSILTAVGNDYGFDEVFKRQVVALAVPGDIVVGISTSGHSNNVFRAITAANEIGCKTVGLLGRDGGAIAGVVDVNLTVPVQETPHIQEAHVTIIHIICALIEKQMFG
jgi:D-sedoheptulose 7-phosphate isomerase